MAAWQRLVACLCELDVRGPCDDLRHHTDRINKQITAAAAAVEAAAAAAQGDGGDMAGGASTPGADEGGEGAVDGGTVPADVVAGGVRRLAGVEPQVEPERKRQRTQVVCDVAGAHAPEGQLGNGSGYLLGAASDGEGEDDDDGPEESDLEEDGFGDGGSEDGRSGSGDTSSSEGGGSGRDEDDGSGASSSGSESDGEDLGCDDDGGAGPGHIGAGQVTRVAGGGEAAAAAADDDDDEGGGGDEEEEAQYDEVDWCEAHEDGYPPLVVRDGGGGGAGHKRVREACRGAAPLYNGPRLQPAADSSSSGGGGPASGPSQSRRPHPPQLSVLHHEVAAFAAATAPSDQMIDLVEAAVAAVQVRPSCAGVVVPHLHHTLYCIQVCVCWCAATLPGTLVSSIIPRL